MEIEVPSKKLVTTGARGKLHIRKTPYRTYCNRVWLFTFKSKGLVAVTDRCADLCKQCLKNFSPTNGEGE